MTKEVRRTGDGNFYVVSIDKKGISEEVYVNDKLLKFETSEEAKDYIKDYNRPTEKNSGGKRWRNTEKA